MSSDHFDGKKFFNPGAQQAHGFRDLLRWQLSRSPGTWRKWVENDPQPPPLNRVAPGELRVTFVGHATVLIQFDRQHILTDPFWSMRASPLQWAGPRRMRPPGIRLEDLPPLDIVLLSHNHYDHCDVPTLRKIARTSNAQIFTPLGLRPLAQRCGFGHAHELDWWDEHDYSGIRVRSLPAHHFSARTPFDRNGTLWCGYEITSPNAGSVQFLGDTAFGDHFEQIAACCEAPRLALLPIGAYAPEWFMGPVHMTPQDAVRAHHILGAQQSMAIHFGTIPLADDGEFDPVRRLARELERRNDGTRFWWLQPGESRRIE